jgi:hypothetical protein
MGGAQRRARQPIPRLSSLFFSQAASTPKVLEKSPTRGSPDFTRPL